MSGSVLLCVLLCIPPPYHASALFTTHQLCLLVLRHIPLPHFLHSCTHTTQGLPLPLLM